MEAFEFGKGNSRKIVLLPGNMMSWRQFEHELTQGYLKGTRAHRVRKLLAHRA